VTKADWRASADDIDAILGARHGDPFAVLGPHETPAGYVIRACVPGATRVEAIAPDGGVVAPLGRVHADGFFEGLTPLKRRAPYRLVASNDAARWEFADPYSFSPVLGPTDDHLLVEGAHQKLYDKLGAHMLTHEGVDGTHFAVWAPNARRSVLTCLPRHPTTGVS